MALPIYVFPSNASLYAGWLWSNFVHIALLPEVSFKEVVTRIKSCPSLAKIVAISPVVLENLSSTSVLPVIKLSYK